MRMALSRTRKKLASWFYQLFFRYAVVADHLKRIGQVEGEDYFWCGIVERQTRFHLFVKCRR